MPFSQGNSRSGLGSRSNQVLSSISGVRNCGKGSSLCESPEKTMSCDELRRIADLSREGMLQTVKSSGDSELDTQLYSVTQKEVAKGFLVGPLTRKTCRQGLH